MRFNPKTKEELQMENLLPDGKYAFEVYDAKDKVSKAGAEMIELQLRIYDENDKARFVYDYLLSAMEFKLAHFCEATGLEQKYNDGLLEAVDCIGKKGYVDLVIRQDKTGQYPPKNSAKDYIVSKQNELPLTEKKDDFFTDDVPF